MLQKRNDIELIEYLRKNPSHIREIAHTLKLIPSTVLRTLRDLQNENAVDFKKEGRNSRYFLRDTLEAQQYLAMSENYKVLKALGNPVLRRIIKELKSNTNGELIVLYGSYAKGSESGNSDIDIYVETDSRKLKEKLQEISGRLSIKIGKFEKTSALGQEILNNHIVLQNLEKFYRLTR